MLTIDTGCRLPFGASRWVLSVFLLTCFERLVEVLDNVLNIFNAD